MGIRIINLLFLSFVLVCSCKTKKESLYPTKDDFIQAYKIAVFYGCYNEATGNQFSKFIGENEDLGLASIVAVIYHAETELARNLGSNFGKTIQPSEYADYQGKSPYFSSCAYYAFYSREVDSIANALYKTGKNAKMEYIYE